MWLHELGGDAWDLREVKERQAHYDEQGAAPQPPPQVAWPLERGQPLSETAQRRSGIEGEVGGQKTTRWSFSPRMTYSFSNRVRGGANFEIGQTKSLLSGTTNIKELGIDVNISIRGE